MGQLSALVSEKTQILTDFLSTKEGPNASSLSSDELAGLPISPDDSKTFKARTELIQATRELHDIVLGPQESLRALAWGVSLYSIVILASTWHSNQPKTHNCTLCSLRTS